LRALDYPQHRLDIKIVTESDDTETIAAAEALNPGPPFEIVRVPPHEPRTKPAACNYALNFARGEFVVIFDAEDRPEPDQLRKAVAAFRNAPPDVGCLQARLNFYNAKENWLTTGLMAQTPHDRLCNKITIGAFWGLGFLLQMQ
jgi:cellulose synthase/poly-beta-1,6-N-acetylglucosamine synthase-like glycosyltransferase